MSTNDWPFCVSLNQTSIDQIRKIVRDEVDKALLAREYPPLSSVAAKYEREAHEDKRREALWYEVDT